MPRETWANQVEYILTLMGYTVGVANVWKFPYMCVRNGGGSFMIPYLFFALMGAFPLTYLEMFLGQFSQEGVIGTWEICPAVKGLAGGACLLCGLFSIYQSTFFSWILYYFFYSFYPQLPWTLCGQSWNSPDCEEDFGTRNISLPSNITGLSQDTPKYSGEITLITNFSTHSGIPAAEDFFRNNVLQITDGLEDVGTLRWPLVLCSAATFLIVYLCVIKGIRLVGKIYFVFNLPKSYNLGEEIYFLTNYIVGGKLTQEKHTAFPALERFEKIVLSRISSWYRGYLCSSAIVYVTVICPYILVTVFLIRALTLPGSVNGILYYITPQFDRLKNFEVWIEACGYALYVPGITYGVNIKLSAHNQKNNNCFRDAFLITAVSALSQLYFGFSVFGITGHLAHVRGVTMDHYKTSGFKLGFITYPEAVAFLPLPQLWAVFLFVMLFTLGIDCLIPSFEVVTDTIGDIFPKIAKRRWLLNAVVLVPCFLLALPYTAQGGVYILTLVEWFAFFPSLVVFAIMECVAVAWIYGAVLFNIGIPNMNKAMMIARGTKIARGMDILWTFICPSLLLIIFGNSLYSYRPPQFEEYTYPAWANVLGWLLSVALVLPLPAYFLWVVVQVQGQTIREKLANVCKPGGKWNIRERDLASETGVQVEELANLTDKEII